MDATFSDPHVSCPPLSWPGTLPLYSLSTKISPRNLRYVSRFLQYLASVNRECLFSRPTPRVHARGCPSYSSRPQRFKTRPPPKETILPPGWTHRILSRNTPNQRLGFLFGESILLPTQQAKREKRFETSPSEPSRWPSTRSVFGTMRERCTSPAVSGDGSKRF